METLYKKISLVVGTVVIGAATGVITAHLLEKRKEKRLGGKLMRVNYRFTKDFDD